MSETKQMHYFKKENELDFIVLKDPDNKHKEQLKKDNYFEITKEEYDSYNN